jgi:anthranilate phosphoribosyltransferase
LNTAASLLIAERVGSIEDGIGQAATAIDEGRAAKVLEMLAQTSNGRREVIPS